MITSLTELTNYLSTLKEIPATFKVAVGSLIFTPEDNLILLKRGDSARDSVGKLEGIGGSLEPNETDLLKALQRETSEELGKVDVKISDLLTIMTLPGNDDGFWVVPIYLGQLISGSPQVMEPDKCQAICYLKLEKIKQEELSDFQKMTMVIYKDKFGDKPFYEVDKG